jgi:hypothetical protein
LFFDRILYNFIPFQFILYLMSLSVIRIDLSCLEVMQIADGMSVVVLLMCLLISEMMQGGMPRGVPPPVKLKSRYNPSVGAT